MLKEAFFLHVDGQCEHLFYAMGYKLIVIMYSCPNTLSQCENDLAFAVFVSMTDFCRFNGWLILEGIR